MGEVWSVRMGFAAKLSSIISDSGLSIDEISERSGLSVKTIKRYMAGVTSPRVDDICRLAKALCVNKVTFFIF